MPVYHARGVRIRLGVSDLDETITPAAILMRKKGAQAASNADKAGKTLRDQQPYLAETNVPIAGDTDGFSINFIPGALTPFLQVQVSLASIASTQAGMEPGIRGSHRGAHAVSRLHSLRGRGETQNEEDRAVMASSSKSSQHPYHVDNNSRSFVRRPTSPEEDLRTSRREVTAMVPKAVALHILLSDLTYLPNSSGQPQSLKVEVFFNGMMVQSVLMLPSEVKSQIKSNHQCFAGTRVAQLAERPWVIVPPDQKVDGSRQTSNSIASAEDRWLEISAALLYAAEARGVDKDGKAPPSATYLEQLAIMTMPEGVAHMQELGGRQFGVIDVVITAGSGNKAGGRTHAQYLHKPLRLIDERFKARKEEEDTSDDVYKVVERKEAAEEAETEPRSDCDAEGVTDSDFVDDGDDVPSPQVRPEPSSALQGKGTVATAPSTMTLRTGASPQVVAHMYPIAAAEPSVAPDPFLSPSLSADASLYHPQLAQYQQPLFPATGLHYGPLPPAPSPASGFDLADPIWDSPYESSHYGSGHMVSHDPNVPLPTAPSPIPSTISQGWFPQLGSANIGPPLGPPLRPGLPFAGRHQVDDSNPMQMLHIPPPGPPPAIGSFSVPQRKVSWTVNPDLPRPSICVSRLVITCALDVVVDYHWQVPQLVRINRGEESMTDSELDQENDIDFVGPEESSEEEYVGERPAKLRRSSMQRRAPATPPPTSPRAALVLKSEHNKGTRVHSGNIARGHDTPQDLGHLQKTQPVLPLPVIAARLPSNNFQPSIPDTSSTSDVRNAPSAPPSKLERKPKGSQAKSSGLKMATGTKRRFDPKINLCEGNPELNKNCVIAYAEGDMGPLRQIRSERQGWFKESEVIVGMRFFIPGC